MNSGIDFTTITTPLIDLRGVVIDIDQTLGAETAVLINSRLELFLWLSLCRCSVVSRALEAAGEEQPINNTEVCSDSHCLSLRSINRTGRQAVAAQPCVS